MLDDVPLDQVTKLQAAYFIFYIGSMLFAYMSTMDFLFSLNILPDLNVYSYIFGWDCALESYMSILETSANGLNATSERNVTSYSMLFQNSTPSHNGVEVNETQFNFFMERPCENTNEYLYGDIL